MAVSSIVSEPLSRSRTPSLAFIPHIVPMDDAPAGAAADPARAQDPRTPRFAAGSDRSRWLGPDPARVRVSLPNALRRDPPFVRQPRSGPDTHTRTYSRRLGRDKRQRQCGLV